VIGRPEFDTSGHGDVRIRVVIVHTRSTSDVVHGIEQIVEEGLVLRVRAVVLIRLYNRHDQRHIPARNSVIVAVVARVVTTAPFEVFGEYGKRGERNRRDGGVHLVNGCTTFIRVHVSDAQ
jgi:hypothetical protein